MMKFLFSIFALLDLDPIQIRIHSTEKKVMRVSSLDRMSDDWNRQAALLLRAARPHYIDGRKKIRFSGGGGTVQWLWGGGGILLHFISLLSNCV
jgi:hypothetical protein